MPAVEFPFAAQVAKSSVEQNSRETLINMFAEVEISASKRLIRRQRAGVQLDKAQSGEKRCIEQFSTNHYLVIGNTVYEWNGTTLTSLGTISSSTGRCTMIFGDGGGTDIMISDGENAYHYNGTSISSITLPNNPDGNTVQCGELAYIDGRGIFREVGSDRFWWTDVGDFTTVDSLSYATAETNPDQLVRVFVDHNEVWLFGADTTEVWQPTGTSTVFQRIPNVHLERGATGSLAVCADDNTIFWLGDDNIVYRVENFRPVRVSTHPIERDIAGVSDSAKANAEAFIYTQRGHKFLTLRFPGELTLQFNIATGFWNRARTFGYDDWRITGSAGKTTLLFATPAGIVSLVPGLSTDESSTLERVAISAPIYANGEDISIHMLRVDAQVGRAAIGVSADVMMRAARDGETFGNIRSRSLGPIGSYVRRAAWREIGRGRRIAIELTMTDATELAIMGVEGELSVGPS